MEKNGPTKEYQTWTNMIARCTSENLKVSRNYLERGIHVCQRWLNSFEAFLLDVGKAPCSRYSLDRIDNNGDYEPTNVRWALPRQQCRNKRNNVVLEMGGMRRTLVEWAEVTGLKRETIRDRIESGWSVEKALTTTKYATRFGNHNNRYCKK